MNPKAFQRYIALIAVSARKSSNKNHFKKTALILFLLFPLVLHARVQGQARVDSLLKELPKAKEDTNKVKILNWISFDIRSINPDEGIKYGSAALSLSEKLGWQKGVAVAYNSLANNYDSKSDFPKAIDYNLKALEMNEATNNKFGIATNLGSMANDYLAETNYTKALEYYFKSLKIEEEIGSKSGTAICLVGIGAVYQEMKNYPKSEEYYSDALKTFEEINDKQNIGMCLYNMGNSYQNQHNDSLALDYLLKALKIFDGLGDKFSIMATDITIGDNYMHKGNYAKALEFELMGVKINEDIGSVEYKGAFLNNIGTLYLQIAKDTSGKVFRSELIPAGKQANLDNAIKYLEQAIIVNTAAKTLNHIIEDYDQLAEAYMLAGNYKEALKNYKAYTNTKDSVFSTDNKVTIANLGTRREADLKEKQIQINKQAAIQERNERVIFVSGALLLLAVIGGVYINYRNQRKTNRLQETMLQQKELLMKEIHHRVKNNLQVISTLLDLQMGGITDAETKDAITESNTRLKAISLIHQQLYQEEHITTIEFAKFATDLHTQVSAVFNKAGRRVEFINDIPHTLLDIDTSVPLGLVLNELITNSYKYAFDNTGGSISVRSEKTGDGYRLIYKDSGPGLPADLNAHEIKSLGMRLINRLSKQLAGAFSYVKETNEFIIAFKDLAGRKMVD